MLLLIGDTNGIPVVTTYAGDELSYSIKECTRNYDKVYLDFNGIRHLITKGLDPVYVSSHWYRPGFDPIKENRDQTIEKIIND